MSCVDLNGGKKYSWQSFTVMSSGEASLGYPSKSVETIPRSFSTHDIAKIGNALVGPVVSISVTKKGGYIGERTVVVRISPGPS